MKSQDKNLFYFLIFLFILVPFSYAKASGKGELTEYSLSLSNQDTYFDFQSDGISKVRVNQLGINWYESMAEYFHAGLEFGYLELSQSNSIISAQYTSGQYVGLLFRLMPITRPYFSLNLNFNYRYNKTEGQISNQKTQFVWDEAFFAGEVQFHPNRHLDLILASEFQVLKGTQQDSGDISQIRSFSGQKEQGYRLGLNFKTNHNGAIGVDWITGYRSGIQLHFRRKF